MTFFPQLIVQTEQAEAREKEENAKRQRQKEEEEQGLQEDLTSLFGEEGRVNSLYIFSCPAHRKFLALHPVCLQHCQKMDLSFILSFFCHSWRQISINILLSLSNQNLYIMNSEEVSSEVLCQRQFLTSSFHPRTVIKQCLRYP